MAGYNTGGVPTGMGALTTALQPGGTVEQAVNAYGQLNNQGVQTYTTPTPSNPYGLYQAPGYTQGYVTGAADNPATVRNVVNTVAPGIGNAPSIVNIANQAAQASNNDYYAQLKAQQQAQQAATLLAQQRASGQAPNWGTGKNADLYNQYVNMINTGHISGGDAYNEQGFRNFAQTMTGSGLLPSEQPTYAPRTAPVTVDPQTIINSNKGLHEMWVQKTKPSDPLDVNSFAKWAATVGYSQLNGEKPSDQFAAYKAAKAAGTLAPAPATTTPVATSAYQTAMQTAMNRANAGDETVYRITPDGQTSVAPIEGGVGPGAVATTKLATTPTPITTPTFQSTGAVKIPTATVAPTGPSKPGYVSPTGRVYAKWTPKTTVKK